MVHACNPSTWEAETRGLQVPGQPGLYSQFKTSLSYWVCSPAARKEGREERGERKKKRRKEGRKVNKTKAGSLKNIIYKFIINWSSFKREGINKQY
jgi:hypothetical protein